MTISTKNLELIDATNNDNYIGGINLTNPLIISDKKIKNSTELFFDSKDKE